MTFTQYFCCLVICIYIFTSLFKLTFASSGSQFCAALSPFFAMFSMPASYGGFSLRKPKGSYLLCPFSWATE